MRMHGIAAGCALTMALVLASGHARADALALMSQFNVISFGNLQTSSEIEGRAMIGGDLSGGGTYAKNTPSVASSFGAVTVYGSVTDGSYQLLNAPGLTVGINNNGNFTLSDGGNISIGGSNSGSLSSNSVNPTVAIGGSSGGAITLSQGGSVTIGGSNTSGNNNQISISGGSGNVAVLGSSGAQISLNSGGSVYVGSASSAKVYVSGSGNVGINGNNTNMVDMGSGTVQINGNSGDVNLQSGSLTYHGSKTGNLNLGSGVITNAGGTVNLTAPAAPTQSLPNFANTFQTPMIQLSQQLNGLANTSTLSPLSAGQETVTAVPNSNGMAIMDVTSSLFTANTNFTINLGSATSIVLNVTVPGCIGTNATCSISVPNSFHFQNAVSDAQYILWNFVDATNISFGTDVVGSVLSPYASVTNSTPIEGTLVAASYTGSSELHSHPFVGTLPAVGTTGSTSVPEPSTLVVLLTGMGALGWLRFRCSHR